MFNTRKPSPYEVVPLSSLRYVSIVSPPAPTTTTTPYSSPPSGNTYKVPTATPAPLLPTSMNVKELSKESGYRLLDLIWELGGTVVVSDEEMAAFKRGKQRAIKHVNQGQHRPAFYVPSPSGNQSNQQNSANSTINALFDSLVDHTNWNTMSNVRRITKDILLYNGVTLDMVLRRARVPLSELKGAGIVSQFQDLVDLGFRPQDLLIDRTLFNCNTLKLLFGNVNYHVIVAHGVAFDLTHLMMDNSFLSSELIALGFPLGQMIDECAIQQSQLRALKFPFSELLELGLRKEHLSRLDIGREIATTPRRPDGRGGFGWTVDEFESLASS